MIAMHVNRHHVHSGRKRRAAGQRDGSALPGPQRHGGGGEGAIGLGDIGKQTRLEALTGEMADARGILAAVLRDHQRPPTGHGVGHLDLGEAATLAIGVVGKAPQRVIQGHTHKDGVALSFHQETVGRVPVHGADNALQAGTDGDIEGCKSGAADGATPALYAGQVRVHGVHGVALHGVADIGNGEGRVEGGSDGPGDGQGVGPQQERGPTVHGGLHGFPGVKAARALVEGRVAKVTGRAHQDGPDQARRGADAAMGLAEGIDHQRGGTGRDRRRHARAAEGADVVGRTVGPVFRLLPREERPREGAGRDEVRARTAIGGGATRGEGRDIIAGGATKLRQEAGLPEVAIIGGGTRGDHAGGVGRRADRGLAGAFVAVGRHHRDTGPHGRLIGAGDGIGAVAGQRRAAERLADDVGVVIHRPLDGPHDPRGIAALVGHARVENLGRQQAHAARHPVDVEMRAVDDLPARGGGVDLRWSAAGLVQGIGRVGDAALRGDQAGTGRAVPDRILQVGAGEVHAQGRAMGVGGEQGGEVGLCDVDARIDDGDAHAGAVVPVGLGQVRAGQVKRLRLDRLGHVDHAPHPVRPRPGCRRDAGHAGHTRGGCEAAPLVEHNGAYTRLGEQPGQVGAGHRGGDRGHEVKRVDVARMLGVQDIKQMRPHAGQQALQLGGPR